MDNVYYEQADLWNQPPQPFQSQVRQDIFHLIPEGINNVLDVGCGNGYITNAFPDKLMVVGTDTSIEALRYVNRHRLAGSITHLPFPNESFDLVQATDVIEHIPEDSYFPALQELQRVARKYILICVPFMENLPSGLTKCAACGNVYHVNHHYRSFGVMELVNLFNIEWVPTVFVFSGETINPKEFYFRSLRSRLGVLTEWNMAICPVCSAKASTKLVDSQTEHAVAVLSYFVPTDYSLLHPDRSECLVLFERSDRFNEHENNDEILQLIGDGLGKQNIVPARKEYVNGQLIMETHEEQYSQWEQSLWLVLKSAGHVYCYPNPQRINVNQVLVPAWFTHNYLKTLSSSTALLKGDKGSELLWVAIRNMESELSFRRTLKGILYTILERLGLRRS
jgi:SAM-dependent methyltransferase